ncbi:MAG: hypothetical protein AAF530_19250 [Pseudomonadota bacterium]
MSHSKTLKQAPTENWISGSTLVAALQLPLFAVVAVLLPPRFWGPFTFGPAAFVAGIVALRGLLSPRRFAAKNKHYTWLMGHRPTARQAFQVDMERRAVEAWTQLLTIRCLCPGASLPTIDIEGEEHLKAALAEGRGAVIWDSTFTQNSLTTKMGLFQAGYAMLHLSRPDHGLKSGFARKYLNPIKIAGECKFLGERVVIQDDQPGPAMRRLAAGLRENQVVSITVINLARKVLAVRCLQGEIDLAMGPAALAIREGAKLLPVFTLQTGINSVRITIEPPLPLGDDLADEEALQAAFQIYGDALGRHLRVEPGQWQGWLSVRKPMA